MHLYIWNGSPQNVYYFTQCVKPQYATFTQHKNMLCIPGCVVGLPLRAL